MIRVSVIIPTLNRGKILEECLISVVKSITAEDEIIVINDSKDQKVTFENKELTQRITLLDNSKQGVASARNLGASLAKGAILLFIDDDMIINSDAIEKCLVALNKTEKSVINADWSYLPTEIERLKNIQFGRFLIHSNFTSLEGWCAPLPWKKNTLLPNKGITSQFLMLHKSDYSNSGGYNNAFPFAGFEDYDLGVKLMKTGLQCYINTDCMVYHNEMDRMNVNGYLERKFRGAITRQKAVELGYVELSIQYTKIRKLSYQLLSKTEGFLRNILKIIPNYLFLDGLYSFVMKKLVGINIFRGYHYEK